MVHIFTVRMILLLIATVSLGFLIPELEALSERHSGLRYLPEIIFAVYIAAYIYLTLLSRSEIDVPYVTGVELRPLAAIRRALRSGSVIPIRGIILNVLLFIPMGYLLPLIFKKLRKHSAIDVVLICLLISLATETLQLVFRVGWFDADDIINNTIGALIGVFIWRVRN
jgi:glycopeptide antibiotics resistance protein